MKDAKDPSSRHHRQPTAEGSSQELLSDTRIQEGYLGGAALNRSDA
jgi:hypothetical protein